MMFKRSKLFFVVLMFTAPVATSGIPVIDVSNLAQAITQVSNAVQQLTALQNQISNQVNMINHQLTNLRQLPSFIDGDITQQLNHMRTIMANTRGLLKNTAGIAEVYTNTFGSSGSGYAALIGDVAQRLAQVDDSAINALQAIANFDIAQDSDAINRVMAVSQNAGGHLQALQAINQFNAIAARQFSQSNTLLAKQAELLAIEAAQQSAESRQMTQMQQRLDADLLVRTRSGKVKMPTMH